MCHGAKWYSNAVMKLMLLNVCMYVWFFIVLRNSQFLNYSFGPQFLLYKKPSSPMFWDWGRFNTVSSNGRIGYLNKCFLLDCFAKTVPNKELSFVILCEKEINANWVGKGPNHYFSFLIHAKKKRKVFRFFGWGGFLWLWIN